MSLRLYYPAAQLIRRSVTPLFRSTLRAQIDALRTRLSRHAMHCRDRLRRVCVRITPIERVMLRSATHLNRSFAAHVSVQALLSAGISRHTHRVETLQTRERAAQVHASRRIERVLVTQRVPPERLMQRLTVSTQQAVLPRAAMVTRVEQHHVFPRVQLTLVRVQPVMSSAARLLAEPSVVQSPGLRMAPAQHYGAATLPPPLVLPPQELSRLTDHVIRQLDHRVLSYQERTGRV